MTGPQVGIVTESAHGRARILEVRTERVKRRLHDGHVVVVAFLVVAVMVKVVVVVGGRCRRM